VREYLKAHSDKDTFKIVRNLRFVSAASLLDIGMYISLCFQVEGIAAGLEYLHRQGVIHADVKSASAIQSSYEPSW
jgi:hypothetical protein